MSTVTFDVPAFYARCSKLISHFSTRRSKMYSDADCVCIAKDKLDNDNPYLKSSISHLWLFGYELPDTIAIITGDEGGKAGGGRIIILTTAKKVGFLQSLVDGRPSGEKVPEVVLMAKNKLDKNKENFGKIAETVGLKSGSKVATLLKEKKMSTEKGGSVTEGGVIDLFYQSIEGEWFSKAYGIS